jgi:hypothetical protein
VAGYQGQGAQILSKIRALHCVNSVYNPAALPVLKIMMMPLSVGTRAFGRNQPMDLVVPEQYDAVVRAAARV